MARVVKDRIKQTSTTTGTGTVTLSASVAGYQNFSVLGNGATTFYCIEDANGTAFEVGIGTYTSNTLARTTILDSTNSGNAIVLTSGTHDVFVTYPAGRAGFNDEGLSPTLTASGTITAGKPVIQNANGTVEQIYTNTTTTNYDPQQATVQKEFSGNSSPADPSSDYQYFSTYAYDSSTNTILFAHSLESNSYYQYVTPATPQLDGSLVFGTPTIVLSSTIYYCDIAWSDTSKNFLLAFSRSDIIYLTVLAGTIGGSDNARTISTGSTVQIENANKKAYGAVVEWNADNDRYFVCQTNYDSPYYIWGYVVSVSGTSATGHNLGGTRIFTSYYTSGSQCKPSMTYDANSSKMVVMGNALTTNASSYSTYITALTIGTSSISSQGTPQQLDSQISSSSTHGGTETCHSVIYDPTGYKLLFGYVKRNSSDPDNRVRLKVGSLSGTTFTFGSHTELSDTGMGVQVGYDGNLNKFSAIRSSRSTSPYSTSFYNLTYNNSLAITLSTEVDCPSDEGWGMYGVNYNLPYISYNRSIYGTQRPISSAGYATNLKYWSFQSKKVVETTNYDASKYFGVASNSATTTNPVQINVPGSINNAQTGLTVDKDYYVTSTGLIKERTTTTTTPDTFATATIESLTTVNPSASQKIDIIYDTHNDKVWAYSKDSDNSNYPTVVVGDISSGTSITWGTPVTVTSNSYAPTGKQSQRNLASDGAGNILVAYRDTSNDYARLKVGNYSGTNSATFGNELQPENISALNSFDIGYCSSSDLWYMFHGNSTSTKWVLMKQNSGNQNLSYWDYGTLYTGDATVINNVYNSTNNKIIVPLNQSSNGRFYVCNTSADGTTNTGYTLNIGTEQSITLSGSVNSDGRSKLILDTTNNNYILLDSENVTGMNCSVITESSGSLSQSTPQNVSSGTMASNTAFYNPSDQKFYGAYQVYSSPYACKNYLLTVSGTTFTYVDGVDMPNATDRGVWTQGIYIADITKGVFVGQTNNGYDLLTAIMSIGSTTSTVVNGSVFAGTALSATALELKTFPASTIVGKASAGITKGKPVIVEADGDFSPVTPATESGDWDLSTPIGLDTDSAVKYGKSDYNVLRDKFIFTVLDSNTMVAKPISYSGTTITVGTQANSGMTSVTNNQQSNCVSYDPSTGYHVVLTKNSSNLQGAAVTIDANGSISWGSSSNFHFTIYDNVCSNYHASDSVTLGFYSTSSVTYVRSFTTTGGALTSVASLSIDSNSSQYGICSAYSSANEKTLFCYNDNGSSNYISYSIVTSSGTGTTLSKTTPTIIESVAHQLSNNGLAYDSVNDKFLMIYKNNNNSDVTLRVATMNSAGASVTWGTAVTGLGTTTSGNYGCSYNSYTKNFAIAYKNAGGARAYFGQVDINESGAPVASNVNGVYTHSYTSYEVISSSTINASNFFATYGDSKSWGGISQNQYSSSVPNLTAENYIGIAQETVSTNEDVKVTTISGVDANQSNLTPAQIYYVQTDGTLSTTAGSPSVVAGTAIAATQLLVSRS